MRRFDPNEFARNVLGEKLQSCSERPVTGFFRDGCCNTSPEDVGVHTVCVVMTAEFLEFSKVRGNDLSTPRWREALEAGRAPRVVLAATHEASLEFATLADYKKHAIDLS